VARRKPRKARIEPADTVAPEGMGAWILRFLESLRVRNYSEATVTNREDYLALFLAWCKERSLTRPTEITRPILQRYQRHLFFLRKANGAPLSFRSQYNRIIPVRAFFKWLTRENVLLMNPASELNLPRLERRLPKAVLTAEEAEAVLAVPDLTDPLGVRDRAILEVFYSTGMRRMEMATLNLFDLDSERGTLIVRQGKGKKDRMIPIGERAVAWCQLYLDEVRPSLVYGEDLGTLFLTRRGEVFTPDRLTQMVTRYVEEADIGKRGSCHLFRHAMATLMLEGGADVRFIQEMLGHANLATTQIYTQVAIQKLKEIHTATHPGARLPGKRDSEGQTQRESQNSPTRSDER
jgi:integrase/recombinase XerD